MRLRIDVMVPMGRDELPGWWHVAQTIYCEARELSEGARIEIADQRSRGHCVRITDLDTGKEMPAAGMN